MLLLISWLYLLQAFVFTCLFTHAAVVLSHNKERERDGAYSPRHHDHFSEAGDHNVQFDHEAILGSSKEAEEYDHLPPEIAKQRLNILLKKMDLTGDEMIDRNELKAWILRSFKRLSEEEAEERMEDVDENVDGFVSWTEYLSDVYGIESEDDNTLDSNRLSYLTSEDVDRSNVGRQILVADDKIMWKVADKNGDNKLNLEEWNMFSNPEEHPDMLPVILQQTLKEKDKNGDGFINFQEFLGSRGKELDKVALEAEKVKFDEEHDTDRDGKLNSNEILSWIVPSNEEIAEEEVAHLFAHSDDNHDNILSFDEILEHHDIFVGSEATDYGDHLHNIHRFEDEL